MLSLRKADPDDLPAIARLADDALGPASHAFEWTPEHLLVAQDVVDNRIVGFVQHEERPGLEGHIGALAVAPERRLQGLGGTLLAMAVDDLTRRGVRHVSLEAHLHDGASRALYRRYGFEPEGCCDDAYPDGQPAVRLGRCV